MPSRLAAKLLTELHARFASRGFRVHEGAGPLVSFPAAHPEVGDLRISDDIDELTIEVGALTHGHFASYDGAAGRDANEDRIVADVVEFLEAVFAERIEFFVSTRMGGWRGRGSADPPGGPDERIFVWSGPMRSRGPAPERRQ